MSQPPVLICDPALPPPAGNNWPFQWLAETLLAKNCSPLTPNSSADDVEHASFDLMTKPEREVLDEVRLLPRRALVELLSHPVAGEPLAAFLDAAPDVPVPAPVLDISPLLQISIDWQALVAAALPGVAPRAVELPASRNHLADPPHFDLGELAITPTSVLPRHDIT